MSGKLFKELRDNFEQVSQHIADTRRQGHNLRYTMGDFVKCAFAVFFFQHQSMLDFQRQMKKRLGRDNMETVFGVSEIPTDTQIRTMMDRTEPEQFSPLFNSSLRIADEAGILDEYRVLDGGVLLALDGVWYHASENIHCDRCLHTTKDDVTTYYHVALAGAIVKPGCTSVLPVMAEMIANGDGAKKQDCELTAAKRWLGGHGEEYAWLNPTLLGDDLYSHEPFCRQVLAAGYHFIYTCKEKTHQWLYETVKNSEAGEWRKREWNGRHHLVYTYRWVNGVPIRYTEHEGEALKVNWLEMSIWNEEKECQVLK